MKSTYVFAVKYRGTEVIWDRAPLHVASPAEAREKGREYLSGVNQDFRIYVKTPEGFRLVEGDE